VLSFFVSCSSNSEPYDSLATGEVTISSLMQLDGGDELVIGNINQVEITDEGTILMLDTQQLKIHLFDSEGNFIRSALTEGEGPGEVRRIGRMSYSNDIVQIYDWSQRKLSQFRLKSNEQNENSQLVFVQDFRPEFYPNEFHISPENVNYVLVNPEPIEEEGMIKIQSLSQDGELNGDPSLSFPENETIEIRNDQGQLRVTFSSPHSRQIIPVFHEDKLFIGRSERIGFEIYDLSTGSQIDSVAFNRPEIELTSGEKREFLEEMTTRMGMEQADLTSLISQMPDLKGKVRNMHYDPDGVIWQNLIGDETDETPEWLLLSEEGELLGKVSDEFEGPVMSVKSGKVYVRESTEEGYPPDQPHVGFTQSIGYG